MALNLVDQDYFDGALGILAPDFTTGVATNIGAN
jgi:hypothetical protein